MANENLKKLVTKARDNFEKTKLDDNRTIRYRFGQTVYMDGENLFTGLFVSENGEPKSWNGSSFSDETLSSKDGFLKLINQNIDKNKKDVLSG